MVAPEAAVAYDLEELTDEGIHEKSPPPISGIEAMIGSDPAKAGHREDLLAQISYLSRAVSNSLHAIMQGTGDLQGRRLIMQSLQAKYDWADDEMVDKHIAGMAFDTHDHEDNVIGDMLGLSVAGLERLYRRHYSNLIDNPAVDPRVSEALKEATGHGASGYNTQIGLRSGKFRQQIEYRQETLQPEELYELPEDKAKKVAGMYNAARQLVDELMELGRCCSRMSSETDTEGMKQDAEILLKGISSDLKGHTYCFSLENDVKQHLAIRQLMKDGNEAIYGSPAYHHLEKE